MNGKKTEWLADSEANSTECELKTGNIKIQYKILSIQDVF